MPFVNNNGVSVPDIKDWLGTGKNPYEQIADLNNRILEGSGKDPVYSWDANGVYDTSVMTPSGSKEAQRIGKIGKDYDSLWQNYYDSKGGIYDSSKDVGQRYDGSYVGENGMPLDMLAYQQELSSVYDPRKENGGLKPEEAGKGEQAVDNGSTMPANVNSPYITREELQNQVNALGLGQTRKWMEDNGLWDDGSGNITETILSKRDLENEAGYVPFNKQSNDFNPSWIAADVANANSRLVNRIATARSEDDEGELRDWKVDVNGKRYSGNEVDNRILEALENLRNNPNNIMMRFKDTSGKVLDDETNEEITKALSNQSDRFYLVDGGDDTMLVYDRSDLLWREGADGTLVPYVNSIEDMPDPILQVSKEYDNAYRPSALSESWATLDDGEVINGEDYEKMTKNPRILTQINALRGADLTGLDMDTIREFQSNAGQNARYGLLNLAAPSYATGDVFSDMWAPTIVDGLLSSVPYMVPVEAQLNAGAMSAEQYLGGNANTFKNYGDRVASYSPTENRAFGTLMTPVANVAEQKIGSIGAKAGKGLIERPLEFLSEKTVEGLNRARYGITGSAEKSNLVRNTRLDGSGRDVFSRDTLGDSIAARAGASVIRDLAPSAASEGAEEIVTSWLWDAIDSGGFQNMFANQTNEYDEYGRQGYDASTSVADRAANYVLDKSGALSDFTLGSAIGGLMTLPRLPGMAKARRSSLGRLSMGQYER